MTSVAFATEETNGQQSCHRPPADFTSFYPTGICVVWHQPPKSHPALSSSLPPAEPGNHTGSPGLCSCASARCQPRPHSWHALLCVHSGLAPSAVHLHTMGLHCPVHSWGGLWSHSRKHQQPGSPQLPGYLQLALAFAAGPGPITKCLFAISPYLPAAGPYSQACAHHQLRPVLLLALVPSHWRSRHCWGPQHPLQDL